MIPYFFKIDKESVNLKGLAKYKQIFGEKTQDRFYAEMLASYKGAKAVMTISQSSKNDYLAYIENIADKITVAPLGGAEASSPKITPQNRSSVRKKYGLGKSPYLLYVGGIDLRKNIAGLARDFFALKESHPDLKMVMVGKEFSLKRDLKMVGWTAELEKHPAAAKDIIIPGFVPDEDMAVLYAEAAVFPFPSLYEGFGLPILEAMHMGCPVVCYDNSSLPEVSGNAALVVENCTSMAPAIDKILDDKKLRDDLVKRGHAQVKKFSWDNTAQKTLAVLESAAKSK